MVEYHKIALHPRVVGAMAARAMELAIVRAVKTAYSAYGLPGRADFS